jgi:hypothetical protein
LVDFIFATMETPDCNFGNFLATMETPNCNFGNK